MCTVVFLRRPEHDWPLVIAANRDEAVNRPWKPPARHWPDRAGVVAGRDMLAGGTWLGLNEHGMVAGVTNRRGSLGPDAMLRSRGELPLEALEHADAVAAAEALSHLDPAAWRSFNLFVADDRDAYWIRSLGPCQADRVTVREIPEGISMLTSWDLNAADSARTRRFLPLFETGRAPEPDADDWGDWPALLARRDHDPGAGEHDAMCIAPQDGFGTVCASLIALGRPDAQGPRVAWRFASGPPCTAGWDDVSVGHRR